MVTESVHIWHMKLVHKRPSHLVAAVGLTVINNAQLQQCDAGEEKRQNWTSQGAAQILTSGFMH